MSSYVLLFSTVLTQERLSWLEQALGYYFRQKIPGPNGDGGSGIPADFTVFLTGDALYSISEAESGRAWSAILSLPQVRLICDQEALDLRGLSLATMKERFPDQVTGPDSPGRDGCPSFWTAVVSHIKKTFQPVPAQIGWLQMTTPYMYPSSGYGIRCLSAALDALCGVSLYAYLDGSHICHTGQNPCDSENIGAALEEIAERAAKDDLPCTIMVNRYCANVRGYKTWDDGKGTIGSSFTIRPARIRDMDAMISHIRNIPVLLSENAGCVQYPPPGQAISGEPEQNSDQALPLVILITHSPYSTGYSSGGIAFAVACAYQGIRTSVVFLENGILALTGEHRPPPGSELFTISEMLALPAGSKNLHFYALAPSLKRRGLSMNKTLSTVTEIGFPELGSLLFSSPDDAVSTHKRILFF